MNAKGHLIAQLFTLGLVALAAWLTKSRGVFVCGVLGSLIGSLLAPSIAIQLGPDAAERDFIFATAASDAPWMISGAIAGILIALFVRGSARSSRSA
jgi:hypothetical protein